MGKWEIINRNPYRVLGVYANSPARERVANADKLRKLLRVGRAVMFPLDLEQLLPTLKRKEDDVAEAESKLTLPKERVRYAQFWFVKVTPQDKVAFNRLTTGDVDGAIEMWAKADNASSLQNRVVSLLIKGELGEAVRCAESLYGSFSGTLVRDVLGDTALTDTDEIDKDFIGTLCEEAGFDNVLPHVHRKEWLDYLKDGAVDSLAGKLRAAVEEATGTRGNDPDARLSAGEKLGRRAGPLLKKIARLIPKEDMRYQTVADSVGLEILQCSIDYYNASQDQIRDKVRNTMELLKKARSMVVGEMAKERCEQNGKVLQKTIDALPPEGVEEDVIAIGEEVKAFGNSPKGFSDVEKYLNDTKPHLQSMKEKLGASDTHYLRISTKVVDDALSAVIKNVGLVARLGTQSQGVKNALQRAWEIEQFMDTFDVERDYKKTYDEIRVSLKKGCESWGIDTGRRRKLRKHETASPVAAGSGRVLRGCLSFIAWLIGVLAFLLAFYMVLGFLVNTCSGWGM